MTKATDQIIELLKSLEMTEIKELVKSFETEFGITPFKREQIAIRSGIDPATLTDEKSEFDIMLEEVPADKKISILKVVRGITGLGLKEAKELVEAAPKVIQEAVAKNTAEEVKKQIEEAGGKVSLK